MKEHAGGRALPFENQWVLRAMNAMESRHRAVRREEQKRLFRYELMVSDLRCG